MPKELDKVGDKQNIDNMNHYRVILGILLMGILCSCNRDHTSKLFEANTIEYLTDMSLIYWDLNYKFPTSYMQARDTDAWCFQQCIAIDSMLLRHASEVVFTDHDTVLVITYNDDTITQVKLPCSCDWADEIPYGPRAFDSLNNLILDDFIQVSWHGDQMRLTQDLVSVLLPDIEKRMNEKGYVKVGDDNKEYPQYLLIEYLPKNDSIHLIKACHKYSCYFYDEYAKILRIVFSEYCRNNHVARLLTAVEIYLPSTKNTKPVVDN